ncbi:MAG: hypothetical protein JSU88_02950 [Nitrospinaceae bacterium]|jgi:hypothetical protein|nr:MAG: hypothetical protein JSU88_02950 [Nitrospinaceae bacterium]
MLNMQSDNTEEYRDVKKEKQYRRISFWLSFILATAVVVWYARSNPPDSPEMQKMRIFFKENIMEVSKFLALPREERGKFAAAKKHPFYQSFIKASEVEKKKIKALVHISTDYTPYQYWFNMVFLWTIFFTTFWFLGLMTEGAIILVRQSNAKNK